ncbi:adenosylcobinamide-GDP ribazoletransferase [Leptothoe spongobia]|uniref:Adenosylcobinamide-GDP ribazoletransferase n=1 Tax=Leptothoe spongobia TAU-MAC 1115 TaxID=1967444 RepID=A0A947DFK5_9CYAN|nr:adenosylcobinamide-GDP ribazoletransferase [Leptothoe spongobia]MBT9315739.1 adenosylcobinamide-GDP ribazoletransferase [Leptothoe spongobia TAU-MAC 1115]
MRRWWDAVWRAAHQQWALFNGAVLFYTCLPLPAHWPMRFEPIALIVPVIGLGLGGILTVVDLLLSLGLPLLLRSTLVVLIGVWLTGGLHLDGAMDTADGLAVQDNQQRLAVMVDSHAGAFAVMAAIAILLLKVSALAAIPHERWFALLSAAAWGRWGQQWAIGRYPYLKPAGKGAFHKRAISSLWQTLPCAVLLVGATTLAMSLGWIPWRSGLVAVAFGSSASWLIAAWLNRRLGGHTGDTYGAVVEWVEVSVLVGLALVY